MNINNSVFGEYSGAQVILASVATAAILTTNVFVILRRKFFPLNKRSILLTQLITLISILMPLFHTLRSTMVLPCALYWIVIYFIPFEYCILLQAQALRVFYHRRLYERKQETRTTNSSDEGGERSAPLSERFMDSAGSPRFNFAWWLGQTIVFFAICVPLTYKNSFTWNPRAETCAGPELIFLIIAMAVWEIIVFVTIRLMFKTLDRVEDLLKARRDSIALVVLWCVTIPLWAIGSYFTLLFPMSLFMASFGFTAAYFLTIGWTLVTTYEFEAYLKKTTSHDQDLKSILEDNTLRKEFEAFLKSEWSVENLKFLESVTRYTELFETSKPSVRYTRAQKIYKKFILEGPYQVNVNYTLIPPIERQIKEGKENPEVLTVDLFKETKEEVWGTLQNDCLIRFNKFKQEQAEKEQANLIKKFRGDKPLPVVD